jgi:hypothetical protein
MKRDTLKKEMIGKKFGTLLVLNEIKERDKNGFILYQVRCECGKVKNVLGSSLRNGGSRSCNKCHTLTGTHGMWKSREFRIWTSMKSRCSNPNDANYKNYGARGIKVCDEWVNNFKQFYLDMGDSNGLSIDRINVNGIYEKDNCRWIDMKTQSRNKRNNIFYKINGVEKCISEICEELNMASSTFRNRLTRGWSIEKIISTPSRVLNKKIKD